MAVGALRALVLQTNISTHGVDITVTRPAPDDEPIETQGIWLTPITEDVPGAVEFQRREPRGVMAIARATVSTVPRGTLILAPEQAGGPVKRWRVDGLERQEADHNRVVVVSDPDPEP